MAKNAYKDFISFMSRYYIFSRGGGDEIYEYSSFSDYLGSKSKFILG